jgi:hypothetical protein
MYVDTTNVEPKMYDYTEPKYQIIVGEQPTFVLGEANSLVLRDK